MTLPCPYVGPDAEGLPVCTLGEALVNEAKRLRKLVTAFASVDPQPDLHTECPWCEQSEHHDGACPWILANAEVWMDT